MYPPMVAGQSDSMNGYTQCRDDYDPALIVNTKSHVDFLQENSGNQANTNGQQKV